MENFTSSVLRFHPGRLSRMPFKAFSTTKMHHHRHHHHHPISIGIWTIHCIMPPIGVWIVPFKGWAVSAFEIVSRKFKISKDWPKKSVNRWPSFRARTMGPCKNEPHNNRAISMTAAVDMPVWIKSCHPLCCSFQGLPKTRRFFTNGRDTTRPKYGSSIQGWMPGTGAHPCVVYGNRWYRE